MFRVLENNTLDKLKGTTVTVYSWNESAHRSFGVETGSQNAFIGILPGSGDVERFTLVVF